MKSRWLGLVLIGLGAFLVMAAVMAQVWAPGVVKRTPIDVNDTTNLSGHVQKFDATTGKLKSDPAYAVILTKVDSHASDGDVAVFAQTTCVVVDNGTPHVCIDDSDPRLVTAEIDVFATDRVRPRCRSTTQVPPRRRRAARGPGQQVALRRGRRRPTRTGTAGSARPWTRSTTAPRPSTG